MAYPTAKKFRTGSTLAMYSVVVLIIVLMTQIMAIINANVDRAVADATSGWSLRVDYNASTPIASPRTTLKSGEFATQVISVAPLVIATAEGDDPRLETDTRLPVVAVGVPPAVTDVPPALDDTILPSVASDRAIWDLVRSDPDYVLVDSFYGSTGGPPGEPVSAGAVITLTDPRTGKQTERTVAGIVRDGTPFYGVTGADVRYPVFMSDVAVAEAFGADAVQSSALVRTPEGQSVPQLATALQGAFLANGLVATDLAAAVEESYAANNQFFRLMQGYLALGLLVGIISLGVIMVLRALGFQSRTVRRSFMIESTLVAVEGVVIGTVLGIVTTWLLYRNSAAFGSISGPYPIAWTQIVILVGVTLLASVVATVAPARRAARIRPAVAVRVAD
jgi:putative ABC transport system permease protein